MRYTDRELAHFRTDFARRRRNQLLATAPALGLALVSGAATGGALPAALGVSTDAMLSGVVGVLVGLVCFAVRNWRCPACDTYLGRALSPRSCGGCGLGLR